MKELAHNLALIVSRPWNDAWQVWGKPHYKAQAVVCYDRILAAAIREMK